MKFKSLLLTGMLVVFSGPITSRAKNNLKPRLVVCTDIAPGDIEPDDMESAIRLLCYADRFEIEAIITSTGWNCDPYPAEWAIYLQKVIDGYEQDIPRLMKRSNQKAFLPLSKENKKQQLGYWPSAAYLRSRAMMGSSRTGIKVIGENNDSEGSNFLIRLADEDDPRPIWVAAWGGANTLAQAIWKVKQTRTPAELIKFVSKFRIYTITDQDMQYSMRMNRAYSSHQWLRKQFEKELSFIWDEGTWTKQCSLGKENWALYKKQIQGHGHMGKCYPTFKWGVEGDTPSFLHLMPNGLNDPEQPQQVGWGGIHEWGLCPDSITKAWTSWEEPLLSKTEQYYAHFYIDQFQDFASRIQWAEEGRGNVNPVCIVNGNRGLGQIVIKAKAGQAVMLDASKSYDPDGDTLVYNWWLQPEISTGKELPVIHTPDASSTRITLPNNVSGKKFHVICEIHDNGPFHLVSYRRIIICT